MGGSAKKAVTSIVKPVVNATLKAGDALNLIDKGEPNQPQQAEAAPEVQQGSAQTVQAQGGAQQAQVAGAGEEAQVSRGSGARNTDPRRARAKFRTPTVSVGGTGTPAKAGTSIGI